MGTGLEVLAVAAIVGSVISAGATIYSAEQQKAAADKSAKRQKQQTALQAARERAKAAKAARIAVGQQTALGTAAGIGPGSFAGNVLSIGAAKAGFDQQVAADTNVVMQMIDDQRNAIKSQATAAQVGAVGSALVSIGGIATKSAVNQPDKTTTQPKPPTLYQQQVMNFWEG